MTRCTTCREWVFDRDREIGRHTCPAEWLVRVREWRRECVVRAPTAADAAVKVVEDADDCESLGPIVVEVWGDDGVLTRWRIVGTVEVEWRAKPAGEGA